MNLEQIQQALREEQLDGWLFYDFRKTNLIAYQILGLPTDVMYSRRWFYFVPAQGSPTALISAVESHVLRELPGQRLIFRTWQEMHSHLQSLLPADARIAMEYSPMNAIPYMSRVDAGTVELVRSFGVQVVTSANLAQRFMAQLSSEQMEGHREAGRRLFAARDQLFAEIGNALRAREALNEYQAAQRFLELIKRAGLVTDSAPHVAINANASNPHYAATSTLHSPIQRGDLVLCDFWGKLPGKDSIYGDYTWMAFAGSEDEIPPRQREVFEVVKQGRDAGIDFARERLRSGVPVEGRLVDDATRDVIIRAGYGDYFVHRTGHSIGTVIHGNGANVDNFETQDERVLLTNTCCSIEPGIYLPEFGIRSETDLLILDNDVEFTGGPLQQEIVPLL